MVDGLHRVNDSHGGCSILQTSLSRSSLVSCLFVRSSNLMVTYCISILILPRFTLSAGMRLILAGSLISIYVEHFSSTFTLHLEKYVNRIFEKQELVYFKLYLVL